MLEIKNVKTIELSDWDELVEKTYNKIYSFQQQYGCQDRGNFQLIVPNNETWEDEAFSESIPFEVNGKEEGVKFETWLKTSPEDTEKEFDPKYNWKNEMFWKRNFYPSIYVVANDLFKKGLIEAGEYNIEIDW